VEQRLRSGRRSIGRAAEKRSETAIVTNAVLLGVGAQTSHEHVVEHALAKRRDRCIGRQYSHGEFFSLKGTPWSDRNLYPLKANARRAISGRCAPPAKRVRAWGAKLPFKRGRVAESASWIDFGELPRNLLV